MKYLFVCTLLIFSLNSPLMAQSFWTEWLDRDDPSVTGDWEHLSSNEFAYVCLGMDIINIEARSISDQLPAQNTGQVFLHYDITNGFVCLNDDQPGGEQCLDYEVRFKCTLLCPYGCWL